MATKHCPSKILRSLIYEFSQKVSCFYGIRPLCPSFCAYISLRLVAVCAASGCLFYFSVDAYKVRSCSDPTSQNESFRLSKCLEVREIIAVPFCIMPVMLLSKWRDSLVSRSPPWGPSLKFLYDTHVCNHRIQDRKCQGNRSPCLYYTMIRYCSSQGIRCSIEALIRRCRKPWLVGLVWFRGYGNFLFTVSRGTIPYKLNE